MPAGWWDVAGDCASVDLDDDLAGGASCTDVGERSGDVVEAEATVDVDPNVTGDAHPGYRSEVGWTFLNGEHAHPATGNSGRDRADGDHSENRWDRAPDAAVAASWRERPTVREHRPMGDDIQDQVVGPVAGEVVAVVVDDLVGDRASA